MTRAFTLIETIIVVAITALMMLALANLFNNFNVLYAYQQTFVASANNAGSALNAIGAAVLPADHVIASHTFSGQLRSSGATTLVVELPTINSSGVVIPNAFDYIAFYLSGTDLYRVTDPNVSSIRASGTKKVASLISSLSFSYDNGDFTLVTYVSTNVTATLNARNGQVQTSLHEQFYLRNF